MAAHARPDVGPGSAKVEDDERDGDADASRCQRRSAEKIVGAARPSSPAAGGNEPCASALRTLRIVVSGLERVGDHTEIEIDDDTVTVFDPGLVDREADPGEGSRAPALALLLGGLVGRNRRFILTPPRGDCLIGKPPRKP